MNGRDLRRHLTSLSASMEAELAPVLIEQAERLIEMQKAALRSLLTPPEDTGGLAQSIRREPGKSKLQVIVKAGGPTTTKGGYDRALAFEFGTAKQPARPFFYPAARAMKQQMRYAVVNASTRIAKSEHRDARVNSAGEIVSA